MTIGPATTGHSIVISKAHVAYLADMDEETDQHLFKITQRTAVAIRQGSSVKKSTCSRLTVGLRFRKCSIFTCMYFPDTRVTRSSWMPIGWLSPQRGTE